MPVQLLFDLLKGVAVGIVIALPVGPVGVLCVRRTLLGYQDWLGALGGLFLIAVGVKALLTRGDIEPEPVEDEALFAAYVSTFALTITNPITILAFAGIFAKVGVSEGAGFLDTGVLVGGVFFGSLLWWLGLSFGIAGLRRAAGTVRLVWLNRVSGAILTLSGLGLLTAALLAFAGIPV